MLNAFCLDPATEHEVGKPGLAAVNYPKPHDSITSKAVFTTNHVSIEIRRILYVLKHRPLIALPGKIHLVRSLGKLVYAFHILRHEGRECDLDLAILQEGLVIFAKSLCNCLAALLGLIHLSARLTLLCYRNLASGQVENSEILRGVE